MVLLCGIYAANRLIILFDDEPSCAVEPHARRHPRRAVQRSSAPSGPRTSRPLLLLSPLLFDVLDVLQPSRQDAGHPASPAGMVAGADARSVVAVERFVEEDQLAPVRIRLELLPPAAHRLAPARLAVRSVTWVAQGRADEPDVGHVEHVGRSYHANTERRDDKMPTNWDYFCRRAGLCERIHAPACRADFYPYSQRVRCAARRTPSSSVWICLQPAQRAFHPGGGSVARPR
jgi:hypothetical protein